MDPSADPYSVYQGYRIDRTNAVDLVFEGLLLGCGTDYAQLTADRFVGSCHHIWATMRANYVVTYFGLVADTWLDDSGEVLVGPWGTAMVKGRAFSSALELVRGIQRSKRGGFPPSAKLCLHEAASHDAELARYAVQEA